MMCRLAAYLGNKPQPLSALVFDPPHSLQHAAYAPREQLHGSVNVDGTGLAWWAGTDKTPRRYAVDRPPWSDHNLRALATTIDSKTMLAAVRGATPGIGYGTAHVAPFVASTLAGVHNGWIGGFRQGVGRTLIAGLSDERFAELGVINDSLVLFLMTVDRLERDPGLSLAAAATGTIEDVAKVVDAAGVSATLNLMVASETEIVAVRTSVNEQTNSLYVLEDHGIWIASEPLTPDSGWQPVSPHTLIKATSAGVSSIAIEHAGVR